MSKEDALKAAEAALTKVHDAEAHVVEAASVEPVKPSEAPSADILLGPTDVSGG